MARVTKIKSGDTGPAFTATLRDGDNAAVDLSGATVRFLMREVRSRRVKVSASATVTDAAAGRVSYAWASGDTDTPGTYEAEFEVTFSDGTIETYPNDGWHEVVVLPGIG